MEYSAESISQYIIEYERKNNRTPNNLRLQKLLYFIQGYFYIYYGHKCFNDKIYAWDCGPVIPTIYEKYSIYGNCIILKEENYLIDIISENDKNIINLVLNECSKLSTTELTKISQKQTPWIFTRAYSFDMEITEEKIKKFFTNHLTSQ